MVSATPAGPRLGNKVAVITGAASGIGRAAAQRFVAEGARVVAGDVDEAGLGSLADELGEAVAPVRCDVTDEAQVEHLAQTAVERFGRLDIAFANAGVGSIQPVVDVDLEQWQRVLDINLTGPLLTIKHAARRMAEGGSIVVTASLNAVQPGAGMAAYCSSKAAVAMLVQVAALELGQRGIRVNAVAPGLVRTPLTELAFAMPAIADGYVENTPIGRYARPEEIAGLVAYLVSDEASFVSGSLQLIDGGAHTMKYPDLMGILGAPNPD